MTAETQAETQGDRARSQEQRDAKVSRAERLARLGLRFTKGLPENIRDLVRSRPTGFRYSLSDGRGDRAVPGLHLRVSAGGDSTFRLQYRVRLGPAKGELRQATIGAVTLSAARREARRLLGRVEDGGDPGAEARAARDERARRKSSTLGAFLDHVYQPEVLAHLGDGKGTELRFRKVWKPLLIAPLSQITATAVADVLAKRKESGIKAGTLHRDFAVLRAALRYARRKQLLDVLPTDGEKPAPIAGRKMRPAKRVRYLSDEAGPRGEPSERARFMAAVTAERNAFVRTVTTLALATGMRRANILGLTDAKIHADHILLPAAETKAGKDLAVFINAAARKALDAWKLRGLKGELFPVASFGGTTNARDERMIRGWARLCRKAKVTDFHFHDARHDFASRMLASGASLAMVRDALGHSSIAMTERYAHLERRDLRAAVQAVTL